MNLNIQVINHRKDQGCRSNLVRRLVGSHNDPAKQRALRWFTVMDDRRLLEFGLSHRDIAELRGSEFVSLR
jgi:hypothetical protein